jgi:hypothetical protein
LFDKHPGKGDKMFKYSIRLLVLLITSLLIVSPLSFADNETELHSNRFAKLLGESWYGVYIQDNKAGYDIKTFERITAPIDGWRFKERTLIIVSALGVTDTMEVSDERFYLAPRGELYSSKYSLKGGTGKMTVDGVKEADEFLITTTVAGRSSKLVLPYPVELLDDYLLHLQLPLSGQLKIGDVHTVSIYDPTPPKTGAMSAELTVESIEKSMINGVPMDVCKYQLYIPDMELTGELVVDHYGHELLVDLGTGIIVKHETKEIALKLDESFDVLSATIIKVDKPIEDPTALNSMKISVTGVDDVEFIESDYQRVEKTDTGFIITINRPTVPDKTYTIPVNLEEVSEFLKPNVYIQSDSEEIIALAKNIVGKRTNSFRAAYSINNWVYHNIEKIYTPEISNALQTLQSGQGDCGEHAALAVALCRAAGIPARAVSGLIYWPPGNGFGYHAWIEVYVSEWIAMDPSWDETQANPTHIALATGDIIEQSIILSKVMGKMNVEVLEVE